jgi:hypothetical protein
MHNCAAFDAGNQSAELVWIQLARSASDQRGNPTHRFTRNHADRRYDRRNRDSRREGKCSPGVRTRCNPFEFVILTQATVRSGDAEP